MPDPLEAILTLKRRAYSTPYGDDEADELSPNLAETYPELLRAPDIGRNYAKTSALRRALGIPGADVGDVSQRDYEQAYNELIVPQQEREYRAKLAPAMIQAQGNVMAARARAGTQIERDIERRAFQAEQNQLSREAASGRVEQAQQGGLVQVLDPRTNLPMWMRKGEAVGERTVGSAQEREALQSGQNTLDNVKMLVDMGDAIGWKGIGPAGGVKNTLYKFFGIGDPREDDFRSALQKVRADIMFGAGGKQLTTSEQKVAAGYLTDIYTSPTAARSRLLDIGNLLERAQSRRTGQPVLSIGGGGWETPPTSAELAGAR